MDKKPGVAWISSDQMNTKNGEMKLSTSKKCNGLREKMQIGYHRLFRACWFGVAFALFAYQFWGCIVKFTAAPTSSLVERIVVEELEAPAITVCRFPSYNYPEAWINLEEWENSYGLKSIPRKIFQMGNSVYEVMKQLVPKTKDVVSVCTARRQQSPVCSFDDDRDEAFFPEDGPYETPLGIWYPVILSDLTNAHCDSIMPCLCYTFHSNITMGTISRSNGIRMNFQQRENLPSKPEPRWTLYVHPPRTFFADIHNLMGADPLLIYPNQFYDVKLTLKTVTFLNKQKHPCKNEEDYSYSQCIEHCMKKIVSDVPKDECVLELLGNDLIQNKTICKDVRKFNRFIRRYEMYQSNMTLILESCRQECPQQCKFKFVGAELVETTTNMKNESKVDFFYPNGQIESITENWVYETLSFLAEFGGYLGMFLGVSMLGCYDYVVEMFHKLSYLRQGKIEST